jgi:hypothetical protein
MMNCPNVCVDRLNCSLATGMVVTLYAVADVFGTRLAKSK